MSHPNGYSCMILIIVIYASFCCICVACQRSIFICVSYLSFVIVYYSSSRNFSSFFEGQTSQILNVVEKLGKIIRIYRELIVYSSNSYSKFRTYFIRYILSDLFNVIIDPFFFFSTNKKREYLEEKILL